MHDRYIKILYPEFVFARGEEYWAWVDVLGHRRDELQLCIWPTNVRSQRTPITSTQRGGLTKRLNRPSVLVMKSDTSCVVLFVPGLPQ